MPTDLEKLLVRLEVSQRKFEKQLANASRTADRRANNIEKRFNKMNRNVSRGFDRIGASAGVAFRGVSRFAAVALGALGTRELTRYADAWTRVENQIRAAEQISGTTARTTSRLVDLANESRSGLEETADLYGRLLRVSNDLGASEEQVAQATETVAKAFKAGGAAASEQASGILQLGQALGSGFLQGDELRSLRENAPLVAQAIAKEFETTVGGLKDLGAEGELTADRVFKALLNAQQDIEKAFSVTTPLVADGFTALRNGITEVVAAFSEGSGAGENLAITLQDLGTYLSENTERARIFGARVSEALKIIGEVADSFTGTFDGLSQGFEGVTDAYVDSVRFIIDAMQSVIAAAAGVGVAISTSMLNAVDAVNNGATGIVNAGISAINQLLAAIIADINTVVSSINNVISTANRFGANIGTLGLIDAPQVPEFNRPTQFGGDAVLAYREARDSVRGYLEGLEKAASDSAAGRVRRVLNAGRKPTETGDPRGDQLVAPARPQGAASTQPAKASPKGGGGGGRRGSAAFDLTGLAA
ncbi:MAG: tape measure protein, partial [Pikeienuella sp.]